ncbi:MAG: hypothetical protein WC612_03310 [Bdellovibrionales bacterium]|jgi:7-cyano-7-deazaguanine synthase in queuosine biosynthesis
MIFSEILKKIVRENPQGITPQQMRDAIKAHYPDFYDTESHRRSVQKGHCKNLDHALLAQIYAMSRSARWLLVDKTKKPMLFRWNSEGILQSPLQANKIKEPNVSNTPSFRKKECLKKIPAPNPSMVESYLDQFKKLENYQFQEKSLDLLFKQFCPKNTAIEHILLKVCALNDFYSTHILNVYAVAKHIHLQNVDERLESQEYGLVNDIAKVFVNGRTINFYSFASKYCSHHKPTTYPIYDSFVEKVLCAYEKQDGFAGFRREDFKDYGRFVEIVKKFRTFYNLNAFSMKEIDLFLWLAGKEWFPKKY